MDGVLTDSEPAFHAAVNDMLARYGTHIAMDEYTQFIGSATESMWASIIAMRDLPVTVDAMVAAYEAPLMERLRQPRPPLPGVKELLAKLRARGVPVALCTASFSRWVDAILPAAGIDHAFDAISTADMVERSKPDPAPYLLAAEKLGLPASTCIAVEDSRNGVTSALGAGAYVIQLRATESAAAPVPGVARVITSLADFPTELLVRGDTQ